MMYMDPIAPVAKGEEQESVSLIHCFGMVKRKGSPPALLNIHSLSSLILRLLRCLATLSSACKRARISSRSASVELWFCASASRVNACNLVGSKM